MATDVKYSTSWLLVICLADAAAGEAAVDAASALGGGGGELMPSPLSTGCFIRGACKKGHRQLANGRTRPHLICPMASFQICLVKVTNDLPHS